MTEATLDLIFNISGWLGVASYVYAYWLLQAQKCKHEDMIYSVLNISGALLLIISLIRFWNLPSLVGQLFWMFITIYGMYKTKVKRRIK